MSDEIIVDAYGEEEQALGWYYYLEDRLAFPFKAKCTIERRISPLKPGETVDVIGMAPEDDCMHGMFVEVRWQKRNLGIPLSQLEGVSVDGETQESIEDWQYWVAIGYQL
ncbi:MAG: calcium-binding protein [Chloroflexi bacterium]|nr:calcium-binding protein [Chloroflexota bacterium]